MDPQHIPQWWCIHSVSSTAALFGECPCSISWEWEWIHQTCRETSWNALWKICSAMLIIHTAAHLAHAHKVLKVRVYICCVKTVLPWGTILPACPMLGTKCKWHDRNRWKIGLRRRRPAGEWGNQEILTGEENDGDSRKWQDYPRRCLWINSLCERRRGGREIVCHCQSDILSAPSHIRPQLHSYM